jgi:hypothetical protein
VAVAVGVGVDVGVDVGVGVGVANNPGTVPQPVTGSMSNVVSISPIRYFSDGLQFIDSSPYPP